MPGYLLFPAPSTHLPNQTLPWLPADLPNLATRYQSTLPYPGGEYRVGTKGINWVSTYLVWAHTMYVGNFCGKPHSNVWLTMHWSRYFSSIVNREILRFLAPLNRYCIAQSLFASPKVYVKVLRTSLFSNAAMDLAHVWYDDRYWYKILHGKP